MSETLSELPETWILSSLEDSVDILDKDRKPINAKERQKRIEGKDEANLFPYYGATGQVGWIDDFLFNEELILLGEDGAPFLDYSRDIAYLIKGKTWVNNHAHVLRGKVGILNNKYLMYYLNTFNFNGYVTGTTRLKLNQTSMKTIPIKIAPLDQQHQIVQKIEELFSKLDAGVAALKRTKVLLEQYRQSVLKAAMEGELTKEWREQQREAGVEIEPASELLEKILQERRKKWEENYIALQNAKGKEVKGDAWKKKYKEPDAPNEFKFMEIPKSWTWTKIDQISLDVRYGSSSKTTPDPQENYVPVLRMGNIIDGELDFEKLKYLPPDHKEFPDLFLEKGNLVFNRTNSYELVGKTAVYHGFPEKCSYASYLIRVELSKFIIPDIISNYINSNYGRLWIKEVVTQQVGQANVNGTKLKALAVPLIPMLEQQFLKSEFDRIFSIISSHKNLIQKQLIHANKLRQSILKQAFEGKLLETNAIEVNVEKITSKAENTTLEDFF